MEALRHSAVVLASIRLNNSLALAALMMLYYDYCLTFSAEVERFWANARLSFASVLFVLNRYLGIFGPIPVLFEYFGSYTPELQSYHQYYAIMSQTIVGIILITRTFAFYDRNKWLLAALLTLGITLLILSIIINTLPSSSSSATSAKSAPTSIISACDLSLTSEQGLRAAVAWICMLIVDTVIFALTVARTVRMWHGFRFGLLQVLFRDGAVYYGILVCANVANILTFLAPDIGDSNRGLATTVSNALATTLVSRMFLNLRDPNLRADGRIIGHTSQCSGIGDRSRSRDRSRGQDSGEVSALEFRRPPDSDEEEEEEMQDVDSFLLDSEGDGSGRAL
ncbi:hypothetical protein OH77DRAFT_1515541 [Trametes cingulata]|nr:hypothetical protein OH77DRAFT_1515541 [Trametes cingulata]